MAYDRADWHYGGDFPEGLAPENGATHIGMYLAWAIKRGFTGELHLQHSAPAVAAVREGRMSGRIFLIEQCDEKFTEEDLNDEGNRFTSSYYEAGYHADYAKCFGDAYPSLYHVEDSPSNQLEVDGILDRRLAVWRQTSRATATRGRSRRTSMSNKLVPWRSSGSIK